MWGGRDSIRWGVLFVGLYLSLLTYGTSLDIVVDPFLHPDPPVVLLDFSQGFIPSWVSSHRGIMCFAYYCSFYFLHVWDDDLPLWGMEYADSLG